MTKDQVRARIVEIGIIPAVRSSTPEDALFAAEAVASAGIPIVEVTMTVPGAITVMSELAQESPELIVGAGTVFDLDAARRCLDAGAAFLTTPGLDVEIVEFAIKRGVTVIPGALTPSEVMLAWKSGSDFVKVFPCAQVGGASYIRALRGPFPHVPLIASGGVNQQTVSDFVRAGSAAVGIGRDLIQPRAIKDRERNWIRELAHRYVQMVKQARAETHTS